MGNWSCSVSGLGAGDASRKSLRGSMRSCQRRRTTSSCRLYADSNRLIGVVNGQHKAAKVMLLRTGQYMANASTATDADSDMSEVRQIVSTTALEQLLNDKTQPNSSDRCDSGAERQDEGECSGYFNSSSSDQPDDLVEVDDDDVLVMCDEDKAMMMMLRTTTTTICGEEWINWTALCPCCRRDASDDSIDLQEMIKLEPIRVVSAEMVERQIFGPGGKVGKCLGCFHMGVVVTLEHPCRKSTETRYLIHKLRDFDDETEGILTVARMSAVNVGKVWHHVPDTKKTVHRSTFLDFKNACGNEYKLFGNNCVHSVKRMMELP